MNMINGSNAFVDFNLEELDAFDVEIVEASTSSLRSETAASCLHCIYSCSCSGCGTDPH